MKTTVTSKPYSIRDFENDMARISEMVKGVTPGAVEAVIAMAQTLGKGLTIEQMIVSKNVPSTTLTYEETMVPARHIVNLAQEHAKESTMDAVDNLVGIAWNRGVDFVTQRKSYREVIADNAAMNICESFSYRGDNDCVNTQ